MAIPESSSQILTSSNAHYAQRHTVQTSPHCATPPHLMHPSTLSQCTRQSYSGSYAAHESERYSRLHPTLTRAENPYILRPAASFETSGSQRRARVAQPSDEVCESSANALYTKRPVARESPLPPSPPLRPEVIGRCTPDDEDESEELETPPPPPRSEYDAPTCKFEWKRFKPVEEGPANPKLFVDYREYPRSKHAFATSPSPSRSPSPPVESTPPQRRRYLPLSSLGEMAPTRTPSAASSVSSRNSVIITSVSRLTPAPSTPPLPHNSSVRIIAPVPRQDPSLGIDFHELRITSSASGEFSGPEAQLEPSGPIRRTIQRRRPSPSGAVGDKRETSTEWLEHVGVGEDEGARTLYTCLWREVKDGKTTLCGFQREKSSVKRHIEAIHLKFKPHACTYCPMRFSQKTALKTHINTHTGDAPNKCLYCDITFSDPARRHRHMTNTHGHVSYRKNPKTTPSHS